MNWLPVNGGPLNGGSRLALVAVAATIACSSLVVAAAGGAQEALSTVYSGAKITAAPTLQKFASGKVGGTSFLAVRPKHTAAASANIDPSVELRGFVFRGVEAKAKFVSGAAFLVIPASVLGVVESDPCSVTVKAVATKQQPGNSSVFPPGASIVADSVATRGAAATAIAGCGAFYAETAINGVGEAYARVTPIAEFVPTGLATRPAKANASAGANCQAIGVHVVPGQASVSAGGYDVFTDPHVVAKGSSGAVGTAELVAAPKRELRPRAAASGTSGLVANTQVKHGSSVASAQGAVELTAKANRRTAAASNVIASAAFISLALRTVRPSIEAEISAGFTVNALLTTTYSRADALYSTADFSAQPDVTIRMANAAAQAAATVYTTPYVTCYGRGVVLTNADLEATGTRAVQPKALAEVWADTTIDAIRVLLGGADVGFGVADLAIQPDTTVRDSAAAVVTGADLVLVPKVTRPGHAICWAGSSIEVKPIRLVYPKSAANTEAAVAADAIRVLVGKSWALLPWCWFGAVPDTTVRKGGAVASASANLSVNAFVARVAKAALAATAAANADPTRHRAGNADIYCEVYLRVTPIANLFSFDPANRTFYRQTSTTNFVRNASITEFRRPA